ncbi:hypothetical protein LCGC14_0452000 [marine sediment metagenome]|uniref:Bacteriophage tail tape measure N-terminal domain-containing protein n=1 Tax=marine sediment metagenome TaxID=412755 RepID=A0A0F9SMT8_9ZZZZ
MVEKKASLLIGLKDRTSKGLARIRAGLGKLTKAAKLAAVIGIAALGAALIKATKLASIQEDAINSLNEAMKNNGEFTEEASQAAQDFAAELQKVTTFGDESIIMAQSLLVRLGGLSGEGLENATKATADMAAALGVDLSTAATLVGKTLGSSTNALARYGVEVTGAVGSQERLNSLVQNAATLFGGAAQAEAQTFSGQIQSLQNRFGDLFETIGFQVIPIIRDGILPLIDKFFKVLEGGGLERFIVAIKTTFIKVQTEIRIATEIFKELIAAPFKASTYTVIFNGLIERIKKVFGILANIFKRGAKATINAIREIVDEEKNEQVSLADEIATIREESNDKILELNQQLLEKKGEQNTAEVEQEREKQAALAEILEQTRAQKLAAKEKEKEAEEADKQAEKEKVTAEKQNADAIKNTALSLTDALVSNESNKAKAVGAVLKQQLNSQIDAFAAAEVGKATAGGPLSFGATLALIGPIIAFATAAKAAVGAIQFHQGGVVGGSGGVEANFNRPLRSNEQRAILQEGERVLTQATNEQLSSTLTKLSAKLDRMDGTGGSIVLQVDGKEIARAVAPFQDSFQQLRRAGSV